MEVKRLRLSCVVLAALIILISSSLSFAAIPVKVAIGKGTVITLKEPSKRISISDPEIADVNLISPSEILVNGKKAGLTNLIVWDIKGKREFFDITVFAEPTAKCGDTEPLERYLKELSPDSDIKAECDGNTLVLRGTIRNRYTCKRDKEPVVTSRDETKLVSVIETKETDTCVETYTKIEQVALAYFPNIKVLNLVTIPQAEQVLLEVKVAQIDKGALEDLGLSFLIKGKSAEGFSNQVGAPTTSTTTVSSGGTTVTTTSGGTGGISGVAPGIGPFTPLDAFQAGVSYFKPGVGVVLKALASKNLAKILAEPNLTVRSGEEGKFLVGTKVPIQTVSGVGGALTPSISFEQVGIKLTFKPVVLETGAIRLRIDPAEVSSISQFITFGSGIVAPEIDTRQVTTSVDLKEGESLILAGLLSEEMKKNIQKVPLFGDIPILGAIFRATHDELQKKELAFFITPKLVKPIAQGVKTELPAERPITPSEEREFKWIPVPGKSEEK